MPLLSKFLKIIGVSLLLVIVLIFLSKDLIIKTVITNVGSSVLGAQLKIEQFSWNLFTQKIIIKNLKVNDPPGFEKLDFINIPQIVLQYDSLAILKGNIRIPLISVNLKELIVVKNGEGRLNVDALKVAHPQKKEESKVPAFQIDILKLNVERVIFKDYYKKQSPTVLVYDVNLRDKTFKNVNNVGKMITMVLIQAMKPTAIQGAGIYAAGAIMGVGFIPGAVIGVIIKKDSSTADLPVSFEKAFNISSDFIKEKGIFKSADKSQGIILGTVEGMNLKITLEKFAAAKTRMTVSAHKFMLPKREFAGGIIYQISQRLE